MNTSKWVSGVLTGIIATALTVVLVAPVALSSQDLVKWAASPMGLGLSGVWAYVVFIALDCAAVLCIALTMHSYFRGEAAGLAHTLVWVFAGLSAFANWRNTLNTPARDDNWFVPSMSILGAVLLEVVIRKIRRSVRVEQGVYENPIPRFRFLRWIVAFDETFKAWKLSVIEGVSNPTEAVQLARGGVIPRKVITISVEKLAELSKADQVKEAFNALGSYDVPEAIKWLSERGITVNRPYAYSVAKKEKESVGVGD